MLGVQRSGWVGAQVTEDWVPWQVLLGVCHLLTCLALERVVLRASHAPATGATLRLSPDGPQPHAQQPGRGAATAVCLAASGLRAQGHSLIASGRCHVGGV